MRRAAPAPLATRPRSARLLAATALSAAFWAQAAAAEVPHVVTDMPAVHSIAAQVMGDLGAPVLLLDRGADAHNFQMRPSQARALSDADLLVWIGPELTPWLARAVAGVGISGDSLELLEAEGTFRRSFGAAAQAHDHDAHGHTDAADDHDHDAADDHDHEDDHASETAAAHGDHDDGDDHDHAHDGATAATDADDDHDHDADHAGHDHDGTDPHAWLDPANARAWAGLIADRLAALDPDNAAIYAANAAATQAAISTLEAEVAATLDGLGSVPLVLFHDAYGYFADHFGLSVAGTIALGDAAAPGAGRLAEIRDMLIESGAVCVFPEVQHDPALVSVVVEGTGARIGRALDPSGTSLEPGLELYATLLRGMAAAVADCART